MPDKKTINRARADKREGKSASTQAGEFVRREIDQIRKGRHGAKNAKQAIAIGLSEARRAGVELGENPNRKSSGKSSGKARKSTATRSRAKSASTRGSSSKGAASRRGSAGGRSTAARRSKTASRGTTAKRATRKAGATSRTRSQAALKALKKMPRRAASHLALSRQAHRTARSRTKADRSAAARKAARTRAANRAGR